MQNERNRLTAGVVITFVIVLTYLMGLTTGMMIGKHYQKHGATTSDSSSRHQP